MASLITLANQALAEIAAGSIADFEEGSIEAREANRFAWSLLQEMPGWSDSIPLGRKRIALAPFANDRFGEWMFAYATPADLGTPLAIVNGGLITRYDELRAPWIDLAAVDDLPFLNEGGVIYTHLPNARLSYITNNMEATELSPLMQRAFVLELAARLAMPVMKWDARQVNAKLQQAEVARMRAVADEENKTPRELPRFTSDAEYARNGGYL